MVRASPVKLASRKGKQRKDDALAQRSLSRVRNAQNNVEAEAAQQGLPAGRGFTFPIGNLVPRLQQARGSGSRPWPQHLDPPTQLKPFSTPVAKSTGGGGDRPPPTALPLPRLPGHWPRRCWR